MPETFDARGFEAAAVESVLAAVPETDLDALRASFALIRASTRLVQRLEAEVHREAGWSMAGFRVMFCVWVGGELEPREIARLSGLSRAAVSSVLNTLERDGLVERSRESDDRRLVTVRLTDDGARRLVAAYRRQNQVEQDFFATLPLRERQRLTRELAELMIRDVDVE
jgi:DNA-binding MarR family transcriptional regulator